MKILMGKNHRLEILKSIPEGGLFLEWGCGGSSVWFSENLPSCAKMISIEHDRSWASKVSNEVRNNCNVVHVPGIAGKNATFEEEDPSKLKDYINKANHFDKFDCILVDGVARNACLAKIIEHDLLKEDGVVFVHDYQRGWYSNTDLYETLKVLPSCDDYPKPTLWCGKLKPIKSIGKKTINNLLECLDSKTNVAKNSEIPRVQRKQTNKILWVINVCRLGGTALWALDAIKSFQSGWQHEVVFMHGNEDQDIAERFRNLNVEISQLTNGLTKEILNKIKPSAVFLSNTGPNNIEGEHPWDWLTSEYFVAYIHHSAVNPYLPNAHIDIFVSEYLKKSYNNLLSRMNKVAVVPPGIDTGKFSSISRSQNKRCVIGRVTNDNKDKFPKSLIDILIKVGKPASIVGGEKYYKDYLMKMVGTTIPNIDFPGFGMIDIVELYRSFDIYVYKTNLSETWGRTVSEAMASGLPCVVENKGGVIEQIDHGINGFICDNDEDFIKALTYLAENPEVRIQMGLKARDKAVKNFDSKLFSQTLVPELNNYILKHR